MRNHDIQPCRDRLAAIDALASGDPPADGLIDHIEACAACRAYSRRLARLDALLAETSSSIEDPGLVRHARRRRVSKPRAVLSAFAVVLLGAILAFALYGSGVLRGRAAGSRAAPDRKALVRAPSPENAGEDPAAGTMDPDAPAETRIATVPGERIVETPDHGVTLSLSGEGHAVYQKSGDGEWLVHLEDGLLVVSVERTQPATRMTVDARNMSIRVKGTLLSVRAAGGIITQVDVEEGAVEIRARTGVASIEVPAGMRLTSLDRPAEPRAADAPRLSDLLVPIDAPATASSQPVAADPGAAQAAKALAKGGSAPAVEGPADAVAPYDEAMALRKAGAYEDAVDAFVAAADASSGLTRERCYYQAVDLCLAKLKDHARASALAESYLVQFPDGFYAAEILMMKAKALMGQSGFDEARAVLAEYLDAHPEGSQAVLAHLLLGKILATTFEDCKAAAPHLSAVISDNPKAAKAAQARKILEYCGLLPAAAGGAQP